MASRLFSSPLSPTLGELMLHALFGHLRALLHMPPHLLATRSHELVALIDEAFALEPERVSLEWRAYLHRVADLPTLTAHSMRALKALGHVLPDTTFALAPREQLPLLELCQEDALQSVHSLILDRQEVGSRQVEAIVGCPYLGALRTLSLQQTGLDTQAVAHLCETSSLRQLERLDMSHNDFGGKALELLAQATHFEQLTHLDISHKRKIDAERSHVILTTPMATQLIEFGINRCGLRGLTNELTQHANLQALDISSNYMNDIDLSQFIAHPNSRSLRHLDLGQNSIGDQGVRRVLDQCARVHTLHMAKTQLTGLAAEHLAHSSHELNSIDVSRTRMATAGALTLAEGYFPGLHSLYGEESRLEFPGILALLSSRAFPALRLCCLARNNRTHTFSEATKLGLLIDRAPRSVLWHERERRQREAFTQPATLDLCSNGLSAAQMETLLNRMTLSHFTHIDVSDNPLGSRGIKALLRSELGEQLTHLTAHTTGWDDQTIEVLIGDEGGRALTHLALGGHRTMGDEGARLLAMWRGLERLTHLDVRACGLTQTGVRALLESAHLGAGLSLRVGENEVSQRNLLDELAAMRRVTLWWDEPR